MELPFVTNHIFLDVFSIGNVLNIQFQAYKGPASPMRVKKPPIKTTLEKLFVREKKLQGFQYDQALKLWYFRAIATLNVWSC